MQLAAPAVSSPSVDEVQPSSCCWCRCRPAGVTAETTAVDQPLPQAYRSAGGTSCGPLVCLCYTRAAMLGRSFQSARVIAVVLPLPSVLASVDPTTIVNVCSQFAGFERNRHFEESIACLLSGGSCAGHLIRDRNRKADPAGISFENRCILHKIQHMRVSAPEMLLTRIFRRKDSHN